MQKILAHYVRSELKISQYKRLWIITVFDSRTLKLFGTSVYTTPNANAFNTCTPMLLPSVCTQTVRFVRVFGQTLLPSLAVCKSSRKDIRTQSPRAALVLRRKCLISASTLLQSKKLYVDELAEKKRKKKNKLRVSKGYGKNWRKKTKLPTFCIKGIKTRGSPVC